MSGGLLKAEVDKLRSHVSTLHREIESAHASRFPSLAQVMALSAVKVLGVGTVAFTLVVANEAFYRAWDAAILAVMFAVAAVVLGWSGRLIGASLYALVGGAYAESFVVIELGVSVGDQARMTPVLLALVLLHPALGLRSSVALGVGQALLWVSVSTYVVGWFYEMGAVWPVLSALCFLWLTQRAFAVGAWSDPVVRITLAGFAPMSCLVFYGVFCPFQYGSAAARVANLSVGLAPAMVTVWCAAQAARKTMGGSSK